MFVWLLYDKPWTLPAGGAVVGYITNWLAIKLIFEPVDPVKLGPFVLQGLFLKRQDEVCCAGLRSILLFLLCASFAFLGPPSASIGPHGAAV